MRLTSTKQSKAFGIAVIASVSMFILGCGEDSKSISTVDSQIDVPSKEQCTPQKCEELNVQCGPADDGCGNQIYCGTCDLGYSCNLGVCVEGGVSCVAKTCEELEVSCGEMDDGCGNTLNCGPCGENQGCVDGSCVVLCTPKTCEELKLMCGNADNGCGKELECGGCGEDQTCTDGACVDNCKPLTCEDLSWSCGDGDDGCGGKLECGTCGEEQECKAGECVDLKPIGTITKEVLCRRTPQDRNLNGDSCHNTNSTGTGCFHNLVDSDHTSGLNGGTEPAQKIKEVGVGETFELLAKVEKNYSEGSQVWYQVRIDGQACFLPGGSLKTNGVDVPKYELCSGSTTNFTQGDPRWFDKPYLDGGRTMASDGCGPTSLANVITALKDEKKVTPLVIGNAYMGLSGDDKFCRIARSYGLTCQYHDTQCGNPGTQGNANYPHCQGKVNETRQKEKEIIIDTLKAGGYVMCMNVGKYWTNNGHWITIYAYDKETGNVFADDPMNRKYIHNIDKFLEWNNLMIAITK